MNRMEEYRAMLGALEKQNPNLDTTLDRAYRKRKKRSAQVALRCAGSLAACFAVFVLLVNFSFPVAYACARVPILRELAEAVTFSRSLTDAVENEFVQPMNLSQTENEITTEVAYLIVDQKQVNVFFRLTSEKYPSLAADPDVLRTDGAGAGCAWTTNGLSAENGELRHLTIDFVNDNVPDSLKIRLKVYSDEIREEVFAPENAVQDMFEDAPQENQDYLATFEFLLKFDPEFTAAGKIFPVNQTVVLEGQAITITNIQVYPTHMRVDIAESEENTAWLKDLEFYIETDWGMKFEPGASGITATGTTDTPSMVSYRADSTYFYETRALKLVITGAKWLRKDMEKTYVNLVTGETGELPEGASFERAEKKSYGWVVTFRADKEEEEPMHQLFGHQFYDAGGKVYEINQWSAYFGEEEKPGMYTYFFDEFALRNYPYDEVWLSPQYSHNWTAENQIVVTVQ